MNDIEDDEEAYNSYDSYDDDEENDEESYDVRFSLQQPVEISIRDVAKRYFGDDSDVDCPFIAAIAKRRAGKSYFLRALMYQAEQYKKAQFDACFLFSGSAGVNTDWDCIAPRYRWNEWDDAAAAHLLDILDNQRRLFEEVAESDDPTKRGPQIFVVLDDILGTGQLYSGARGRALTQVATRGRHVGVTCVVALQTWTSFRLIKDQSDCLLIWRSPSRLQRRALVEDHMCIEETSSMDSFRRAEAFYDQCFPTKNHAMVLDLAAARGARSLNEYIYSCAAPSDEKAPRFALGPEHHWESVNQ